MNKALVLRSSNAMVLVEVEFFPAAYAYANEHGAIMEVFLYLKEILTAPCSRSTKEQRRNSSLRTT